MVPAPTFSSHQLSSDIFLVRKGQQLASFGFTAIPWQGAMKCHARCISYGTDVNRQNRFGDFRISRPVCLMHVFLLFAALQERHEWQTVTEENKAGFRFFKVVVELP